MARTRRTAVVITQLKDFSVFMRDSLEIAARQNRVKGSDEVHEAVKQRAAKEDEENEFFVFGLDQKQQDRYRQQHQDQKFHG
jgi:hypothetical protein